MIRLMAPWPLFQTTTLLPNPQFGDAESNPDELEVRRAMDGTVRTFVKRKGRSKLLLPFLLTSDKALELEEFVKAYFASKVFLQDHEDRKWLGHFTNNPFEFTRDGKAGARRQLRRERTSVQLEFEGVEL